MPLSMQAVSDSVSDLLTDEDLVRWTVEERIRWANESLGAILTRRPAALARTSVVTLVAGTRQSIPADGSILLDVVRNMAADDVTPGSIIRRTDRQQLDDADPGWHTGRKKSYVRQYTYDDRLPKEFYVYPPVNAGVKVELQDAYLPDDIADIGEDLGIGAEYKEAVVNYICYRANAKDSEFASPAMATAFYQAFETALGIKGQSQIAASPNQPSNSV